MFATSLAEADLSEAWIEGDQSSRWRSGPGHGPGVGAAASGSSLIEVQSGRRLPRHTDSAEETIVVAEGAAEVVVGEESARLEAGGLAVVPAGVSHEVRNGGAGRLRFFAVYAASEVTTTYESPVQPGGERERDPLP